MKTMKGNTLSNEKGFALLAALMACLILIAIGILVINTSTGDLLTSHAAVGHKKALAAVESGISKMMNDVGPDHWNGAGYTTAANCGADSFSSSSYSWQEIQGGADPKTQFAVCTPTPSAQPPMSVSGFSLGGGGSSVVSYGYQRYDSTVVGKNDSYNSQAKVDIGVGFGPVPIGGN